MLTVTTKSRRRGRKIVDFEDEVKMLKLEMKLRQRGAVEDQNQRNLGKLPEIPTSKAYNRGIEPKMLTSKMR